MLLSGATMTRPMEPEFRQVRTPAELEGAKSVRTSVFVREQNVPPEIEMDEYDAVAIHVICVLEGEIVGTGRLVRMPDGMKLGRVAVLKEHRGNGLGTEIVRWLVRRAAQSGHGRVHANVQIHAAQFYENLGFRAVGDTFLEAGIEHVRMECAVKA